MSKKADKAARDHRGEKNRRLALRIMTMPKDTNPYGTVFGGVILSHVDQAGFVEARALGCHRWVTAAMTQVSFDSPVRLGDVATFWTRTIRKGTSSIDVRVDVEAERFDSGDIVPVTTATLTMVAVDPAGKPIPFENPPTAAYEVAR
ncbi:MAG: hotdog domain-containing protein [Planctomycetota bacterium]